MSRTPKTLALGDSTNTTLNTLYTAPTGTNTTISLVGFTNTAATTHAIDIYHNDGSTDYLIKTITLPAGSGKEAIYWGAQRRTFNSGHAIKIQSDQSATFNYAVHGSEVTI